MDGTQARLKPSEALAVVIVVTRGKGGWDSGEIETYTNVKAFGAQGNVERVDGTQARLKRILQIVYSPQ